MTLCKTLTFWIAERYDIVDLRVKFKRSNFNDLVVKTTDNMETEVEIKKKGGRPRQKKEKLAINFLP